MPVIRTKSHGVNSLTPTGALTLAPTTDTIIADGTGLIVGHTAQVSPGSVAGELQVLGTGGADSTVVVAQFSDTANGRSVA